MSDLHQLRLTALRAELVRRGLDGFVVPRADEHQGEYVPPGAERLSWLTGFTGSAGLAVVLAGRAAVFTDGRYTLQVRAEVAGADYGFRHQIDDSLAGWLIEALPAGGRIGYDPWLHTTGWVDALGPELARAGIQLESVADNPIDAVWPDRPPPPLASVTIQPLTYAGRSAGEKCAELAAVLRQSRSRATVLTMPESVAWLLNIRGGDVPRSPLALSFAILYEDERVELFIDARKLSAELIAHLGAAVTVRPPAALTEALDRLGRAGCRVRVDAESAASAVIARLCAAGATIERAADATALPRACKSAAELAGARAAHLRDGVAMVRFLHWLEGALDGAVTELGAATRLEAFRRQGALFRDLSFETISGAGANGAIVHYRVSPESDRPLLPGTLYLVDSGAQYQDGTTDITRTVALGAPTAEMRERFTRVLKGHIALAGVRFPPGTTGSQLDVLARLPLWQAGLDYDHGTGHGVGSYLSVHEGPQRISKRPSRIALAPGMILSNEPGCYVAGAYGIRIENLMAVRASALAPMLEFETLTLVPIDRALIEVALLDDRERDWLEAYHLRVRESLTPLLELAAAAWLAAATRPLQSGSKL
ncbi:MAG: aminopeptidase P family protein [Rhodospirillaceae bacterium]